MENRNEKTKYPICLYRFSVCSYWRCFGLSFLPPPSTVSAQETVYANTCATSKEVKKVEQVVGEYNDHILYELASIRDELQIIQLQTF